jgi:hypothetical protein
MNDLRDKLTRLMEGCGLNAREIAPLMARDSSTVYDYLSGAKIPQSAAAWIRRVESIRCTPTQITVTLRASGERPGQAFGHRKLSNRRADT